MVTVATSAQLGALAYYDDPETCRPVYLEASRCPRPDKVPYMRRRDAKHDRRHRLGHVRGLNVYRCRCRRWHIGALPLACRRGEAPRPS